MQHNDHTKRDKMKNNAQQNIATHKSKDQVTRTTLKIDG